MKFRSPSFIHKGQKYLSKDVEAAANEGDEDAMRVIAELVAKKSGVIVVEEAPAPAAPKAPKDRKRKSPKGDAAGSEADEESETETEDNDA